MFIEGEAHERPVPEGVPCDCAGQDPFCLLCLDGVVYPDREYGNDAMIIVGGKHASLAQSLKLRNHSPTGFSWGYAGSGPAQTALAILLALTDDPDETMRWYQQFKFDTVAKFQMGRPFAFWFDFEQWKWWCEHGEQGANALGVVPDLEDNLPANGIRFVRGLQTVNA